MDFSRRGFYHPRTFDHDDITTIRRRYNNKFHHDDHNYICEEEYVIKLLIAKASNINLLNDTFPYSSDRIYRVIVSDESGREFSTSRKIGTSVPAWNETIEICFNSYPVDQKLKLMVVRETCYDDPRTSTGEVVVGRDTIPAPVTVQHGKDKVIKLVKIVGVEKRVEALISLKTLLITTIRR